MDECYDRVAIETKILAKRREYFGNRRIISIFADVLIVNN